MPTETKDVKRAIDKYFSNTEVPIESTLDGLVELRDYLDNLIEQLEDEL